MDHDQVDERSRIGASARGLDSDPNPTDDGVHSNFDPREQPPPHLFFHL